MRVLLSMGSLEDYPPNDVMFVVPSLIAEPDALRANASEAAPSPRPWEPVERTYALDAETLAVRRRIAVRIRDFRLKVSAAKAMLVKGEAAGLYDRFKSRDPSRTSTLSTRHAASLLSGQPDPDMVTLLAMHEYLMDDADHFTADATEMRETGTFILRSIEDLRNLHLVREWVRNDSPHFLTFLQKAVTMIRFARENRPSLLKEPLARIPQTRLPIKSFSASDEEIIRFLQKSLMHKRLIQIIPYMATSCVIVNKTDLYEPSPQDYRDPVRALLQDIGVFSPWENLNAHEIDALYVSDFDKIPTTVDAKAWEATHVKADLRPDQMYPTDPHDSVRHDFGSLPVYTIDDAGANELDDGISIERAPPDRSGTPTWWLHVHIADPTRLLHPSHDISRWARARVESSYFPERVWSMLPDEFIRGHHLSLGETAPDVGQKVLTFSARLDASGSLIEYKVRAGIVRNVVRTTYDLVDKLLVGEAVPDVPRTYISDPIPIDRLHWFETGETAVPPPSSSRDDLDTLHQLATNLLRGRSRSGALAWTFPSPLLSVSPRPIASRRDDVYRPELYSGLPRVSLGLPTSLDDLGLFRGAARTIVSESMLLANRLAARFCVERGLSAPFRVQDLPLAKNESDLQQVLAKRDPDTGTVDPFDIVKQGLVFKPAMTSTVPGVHWMAGITDDFGYARATSPLRRYGDLVVHWQIKNCLLPPTSPYRKSEPFFSREEMAGINRQIDRQGKIGHRLEVASRIFWQLYVIQRKLELSRASPETDPTATQVFHNLTAIGLSEPSYSAWSHQAHASVFVPQLGIRAVWITDTLGGRAEDYVHIGEERPVRISDISLDATSRMVVEDR